MFQGVSSDQGLKVGVSKLKEQLSVAQAELQRVTKESGRIRKSMEM